MKRILFVLFSLPIFAVAQDKQLIVEGSGSALYINHIVVARDNFYSIGRMYNVSPKEIAPFNKLSMDKGLNPGQVLKIPLTKSNFSQNGSKAKDEILVPVYHTVKESEGLYRIGINHNKVPVATLKKWNHLTSDDVSLGSNLVVGYLKVKKDQSSLAKATTQPDTELKTVIKDPENKVVVVDDPAQAEPKQPVNVKTPPNVELPAEEPVIVPKKEEPKTERQAEVTNKPVELQGTDHNGGVFRNLYESQTKNNTVESAMGIAGVFKSKNSGWKDGKYYCLNNSIPPGTVVKITSEATGKSIYAKVLDLMPDIRQNAGLLICVSSAAADELMIGENNFKCTLNYSK